MFMERTFRRPTFTQVVFKTSLITLFVAFVSFSYGVALFGLLFPLPMAHINVTIGAHNAAGMYFEREYNRSKKPDDLYNALDNYIVSHNNNKVIKLGGKFLDRSVVSQTDYTRIIGYVNERWAQEAGTSKYNLVSWANEESRIKSAYILALMRKGESNEALSKLEDWLDETIDHRQPNHAFIRAFREDIAARPLLVLYVGKFEPGLVSSVFAYDFLWSAYGHLEDIEKAQYYAGKFYDI